MASLSMLLFDLMSMAAYSSLVDLSRISVINRGGAQQLSSASASRQPKKMMMSKGGDICNEKYYQETFAAVFVDTITRFAPSL